MTDIFLKPICWNCQKEPPHDLIRGVCLPCTVVMKKDKQKPTRWYTELL